MRPQRIIPLLLTLVLLVVVSACGSDPASSTRVGSGGTGGDVGSGGTGGDVGSGGTGGDVGSGGTGGNVGTGGVGGNIGTGGVGGGGNAGTGGTGAGAGTGGANGGCHLILCDGKQMFCGDCIDNDDDGLVDNDDPECLGPCDNTEGEVLLTGVPGEGGNTCGADCYFDVGNGAGEGECKWDRRCDPLQPKVDPSGANPQCLYDATLIGDLNYCPDVQPLGCEESCGALTPNGCDCFGCCTFPELAGMGPDGSDGYVFLGSETKADGGTCTLAEVTNPEACFPCTPAGNCLNTCERCEICLGKPTIPADCFPGTGGTGGTGGTAGTAGTGGDGGGMRCPVGKQVCGLTGDDPCPGGSFCLTGCCTEIVVE